MSSGLLRRVALVRTDVWEEPDASFIRVTKLHSVRRLLVAACVVPSSPIFVTLMKEASGSSQTSVLTRATRRNNPEDIIVVYMKISQMTAFLDPTYYSTVEGPINSDSTVREVLNLITLKSPEDGVYMFSETSVLTRATRCKPPEDIIFTAVKTYQKTVLLELTNEKTNSVAFSLQANYTD
jgi:hypothetical protein